MVEAVVIARNVVYVGTACSICVHLMNARSMEIVYLKICGLEDYVLPIQMYVNNLSNYDNQG